MNFDFGSIWGTLNGFVNSALGGVFGALGLSSETGNGLLNFSRFIEMMGDFFITFFQKLFSGLAK